MDRRRFAGKVVVVTGGSSGVGRAIVRAFAAEGAKVALLARNEEGLNAAASEVRELQSEALVLPVDVSRAQEVDAAADRVVQHWGKLDVWINDAMISVFAPVWDIQSDEYRRVTEVNYLGYVYGTQAALRYMRPVLDSKRQVTARTLLRPANGNERPPARNLAQANTTMDNVVSPPSVKWTIGQGSSPPGHDSKK